VPNGARREQAFRQSLPDIGFDDVAHMPGFELRIEMLCRHHDLRHLDWLAVFIPDRDLGLRVGAEVRFFPGFACLAISLRIAWLYWIGAGIRVSVSRQA
jgi:hypothetical protein